MEIKYKRNVKIWVALVLIIGLVVFTDSVESSSQFNTLYKYSYPISSLIIIYYVYSKKIVIDKNVLCIQAKLLGMKIINRKYAISNVEIELDDVKGSIKSFNLIDKISKEKISNINSLMYNFEDAKSIIQNRE